MKKKSGALFPLQSDAKHVLFSSSMQEFIRVYVSGLAKSHHPWSARLWFSSSAFKLPGMTILRWTLIQESSFYPSYLCRTRKRRLDEEKDGIFFILLSLHTSIFHSHGLYSIILSLFSRFYFLSFWLWMVRKTEWEGTVEEEGKGKTPSLKHVNSSSRCGLLLLVKSKENAKFTDQREMGS